MKERLMHIFKQPGKPLAKTTRFLIHTRIGNLLILLLVLGVVVVITNDIRLIYRLSSYEGYPISTQILDRNDKLIYEIYADQRRTLVKLDELPTHLKAATIAIEDKDFYHHIGFSPQGIARAFYNTFFQRRLQGGSTITQQLVKNTLLTPERTLLRKIHEFYLALALELFYSKDKILELYLNQVPYGGTAWGIQAASLTYFGKDAKDLTLPEAALIAGLPAAPTRFSPFGVNPQLAKDRQIAVLRRMVEDGYITQEESDKAVAEELHFRKPEGAVGIHFALWVKEQLVEEYGQRSVEQGGLRVKTTLDLDIQREAEEIVKTEVDSLRRQKVRNGAALVTSPATGEILAMVGSKDYFAQDEDGKVNVTLANRQPGSSIKPINYALGLTNRRVTTASIILDTPTCFQVPGQPLYCPDNYDNAYTGATQLRFALGNSRNITAVRMLAANGLPEFITFARRMGLTTLVDPARYGLSLTLGGGEVKMTDMATAFGVFANLGIKQELISVIEVKDWEGKILKEKTGEIGARIVPLEVAFLISHILADNNARSATFGATSFLNVSGHPEVSVKTGTTNDRRDNWTIGYTKDAVVTAWVGNNDNTPMGGAVSGVSGASPIWNRITKFTLDRIEKGQVAGLGESSIEHKHPIPVVPEGVNGISVCAQTGGSPTQTTIVVQPAPSPDSPEQPPIVVEEGCPTRLEYFIEGTQPQGSNVERRGVHVDKTTNQLATDKTLPENLEIQEKSVVFDIMGTMYCIDCAPPTEPVLLKYPFENAN